MSEIDSKSEKAFFMSEEGRKISGGIGLGLEKVFELSTGMHDPTGNAGQAASLFAQEAAPLVVDASQKMMETAHAQNQTEADRFWKEHPLRTAEGKPVTAEEAKEYAFSEKTESKTLNKQHQETQPKERKSNERETQKQRKTRHH